MGFLEALTLVFIVLKLVGVVSFSWWIVFSPLLLAVAFYVAVIGLYILTNIVTINKSVRRKRRGR